MFFCEKALANSIKICYTYGKMLSRTGAGKYIFLYNGRDGVITDDNGLYYMRARYYSPEMHRFINADIVAGEISNAVTLNRFAYANGNPVSFVDPFGLSVWSRIKNKAKKIGEWVDDNIITPINEHVIQPTIEFFNNDTHHIQENYSKGVFFAEGEISGGESNGKISHSAESTLFPKDQASPLEFFVGFLANLTVAKAAGKVGIGNENISLSIEGDLNILTASSKVGVECSKEGVGAQAGAEAAVVDGSVSINFEVFGHGVKFTVGGDVLSVAAKAEAGIIKEKDKTILEWGTELGYGLFGIEMGWGLIVPS